MSFNSSAEKVVFSIAFRLSANWPTELAPIMTEVTKSSFSIHASAISARVWPRRIASAFSAWILLKTSSVSATFLRKPPLAMREFS